MYMMEGKEWRLSSLVSQWRGVLAIKVGEQVRQSFRFKNILFEYDFAGTEVFQVEISSMKLNINLE